MTSLGFRGEINPGLHENGRTRRLLGGNRYIYHNVIETNIRYVQGDAELPYIMSNRMHKDLLRIETLQQWNMSFTIDKIKDLADSAEIPIPIKVVSERMYYKFLVGKGFIAEYGGNQSFNMLFVACKPADISNNRLTMKDITFYISKKVKGNQVPRKIKTVIEDFANNHIGDIVYTNDIQRFIGHSIKYPSFSSISQRKEYMGKLIDFCTEKIRKSL